MDTDELWRLLNQGLIHIARKHLLQPDDRCAVRDPPAVHALRRQCLQHREHMLCRGARATGVAS
eukprot:3640265-Heterocapsa_arctica.AAC.1